MKKRGQNRSVEVDMNHHVSFQTKTPSSTIIIGNLSHNLLEIRCAYSNFLPELIEHDCLWIPVDDRLVADIAGPIGIL